MALPKARMTPEEYLKFERASEEKHEYFAGEIFAMSGASKNHNRITGTTSAALLAQVLERPCDVFSGDMRVKIHSTGLYTYPDISVVCGEPEFEDFEVDTLLNPSVIMEVLSPSTEAYDRGKKFYHYQTIPSLKEYLLISQDIIRIDHYILRGNEWVLSSAKTLGSVITLPSIDCTLRLSNVYKKVEFDNQERLHP